MRVRLKARARNGLVTVWDSLAYRRPFWRLAVARMPKPKVGSEEAAGWYVAAEIASRLRQAGITVEDYTIDFEGYRRYLTAAGYGDYPNYYRGGTVQGIGFEEKSLEHFVSFDLLGLSASDVYIDVASCSSPVPDIVRSLYGAGVYRQDLTFREGLEGDTIGGDAGDMPVPDGFATAMALHCSFEHFEGDADSRFIRESGRVLAPGGRLCILPLYLGTAYHVLTDPTVSWRKVPDFDREATVVCRERYHNRFGRCYDAKSFVERVVENLGDRSLTVYRVLNAREVDPSCYLAFAAVIEKPEAE